MILCSIVFIFIRSFFWYFKFMNENVSIFFLCAPKSLQIAIISISICRIIYIFLNFQRAQIKGCFYSHSVHVLGEFIFLISRGAHSRLSAYSIMKRYFLVRRLLPISLIQTPTSTSIRTQTLTHTHK